MKPDARHSFGIVSYGAACESQAAGSGKRHPVIGGRLAMRLLEELLPASCPMGDARTFTLHGDSAVIEHVLYESEGICGCLHGCFGIHGRAEHVKHRAMPGDGFLILRLVGVGVDAIPADIERALHSVVRLIL
ncbi:hypothetical protein D3C71_1324270 [compost metagenome]